MAKRRPVFCLVAACAHGKPVDLAFVIDEKLGGARTLQHIWRWMRQVVSDLKLPPGHLRVKFIQECDTFPALHLGAYKDKSSLLNAIDHMKIQHSRTASMLRQMTDALTVPASNTLEERRRVGVYITDGSSGDLHGVLAEAQAAKLTHNIELFGIGLGRHIDPVELRAIVSCEPEDHLFLLQHSSQLNEIKEIITEQICESKLMLVKQ